MRRILIIRTLDIIKECRQTGKTRTTTKNLLEKAYYEQMTKEIDISTVLIEGDTATIMGVRYQRIIEPQSFYDKIYGLLKTNLDERVDTDDITIRVLDLIRENIPGCAEGLGLPEWYLGYNEALRRVNERLFE